MKYSLNIKQAFRYSSQSRYGKALLAFQTKYFSTQDQPSLYEKLKSNQDQILDKGPVEILFENLSKIDLPAYDLLLQKFIDFEWGNCRPKGPTQTAQKIIEFLSLTNDLKIALNKEQLCKLIDMYCSLIQVIPPYKRIEVVELIAKLEQKTSNLLKTAFIDELDSFYKTEFAFIKTKILDIESPKALIQIANALKLARYYDKTMITNLALSYSSLGRYNQQNPQLKEANDISYLISALAYFNIEDKFLGKVYHSYILGLLKDVSKIDNLNDLNKLKHCILIYLRYQALFPNEDHNGILLSIKVLLKDFSGKVQLSTQEYNQLYQVILLFKEDLPQIPQELVEKLELIWRQSNQETTITKFEQDVLDVIKSLPVKFKLNRNEQGIEKDVVITHFKDQKLERPLAVEINGVYHYCRNSEEQLGRDAIKQKILAKQGYQLLVVPYFHWYILEDSQKPKYLKDVIANII